MAQEKVKNSNVNPLSVTWKVFSTISGVIGLVSFTEDIIAWKKFVPEIVESYQNVVHYPFEILNLDFNEHLIDYLFIGLLCGVAFIKAIGFGENNLLLNSRGYPKLLRIFYFLLYLILWPLGVLISLNQAFFNSDDESERHIKLAFLRWLLTIILVFLIILILNKL